MKAYIRIVFTYFFMCWKDFVRTITFWDYRLRKEIEKNGGDSEKAAKIAFEGVDIIHMGNSIRFLCALKKIFSLIGKPLESSSAYEAYAYLVQNKPLPEKYEAAIALLNFCDRVLDENEVKELAFQYIVACGDIGEHARSFYRDLNNWLNNQDGF